MGVELEKKLKLFSIIFGLILMVISLILLFFNLKPYFSDGINFNLFLKLNYSIFTFPVIIFILGYVFYTIGKHYKNLPKFVLRYLIVFYMAMLISTFFLYILYIHSDNLTNSIQPSINTLFLTGVKNQLNTNLTVDYGKNISLLISNNISLERIYVSNLTQKQVNLFSNSFGYNNESYEKQRIITTILVSKIYENIVKLNYSYLNIPIPLSNLTTMIPSSSIKPLTGANISLLKQIPILNQSYIFLQLSNKSEVISVTIGAIPDNTVKIIWRDFGFNTTVSTQTMQRLTNIFLSQILKNIQEQKLNLSYIPVSNINSQVPVELKSIIYLDIYNPNANVTLGKLNEMQNTCANIKSNGSVCSLIMGSTYSSLYSNLNKSLNNMSLNTTFKLSSDFNTIPKLNSQLNNLSAHYTYTFFVSIFFLSTILLFGIYFSNKKKESFIETFYFISKQNFFDFTPSVIVAGIIFYLFKTGLITTYLFNNIGNSIISSAFSELTSLPIFFEILNLLFNFFEIILIYYILSFIIFLLFYYFHSRNVVVDSSFEENS